MGVGIEQKYSHLTVQDGKSQTEGRWNLKRGIETMQHLMDSCGDERRQE